MSSTVRILSDGTPPEPPPPIDDSTSALDYKTSHKVRPPPLLKMDPPRTRSAEETVNVIYSMPPPNLLPYKKHNELGVLLRASGVLAGGRFNIDSLVVCRTEIRDLSRMCIVISGRDGVVEQARRQLEDLVPVWAVLDYTETRTISRELLLVKVSIIGPEYLEDQLEGGPSHEPRAAHRAHAEQTKLEREMARARHFEESTRLQPPTAAASEGEEGGKPLAPSESTWANSVIVEMTEKTARVKASFYLVKPALFVFFGTRLIAMQCTRIAVGSIVDASLLPPV
ncbi:acetolactate synthase [Lactarius hengduanensis]|nr:acetolactate synthase [Lactarius hengduanensis]